MQLLQTVTCWFDSHRAPPSDDAWSVDWVRVVPFLGVHLACLGVIWVGWSWSAVGIAVGLYFLRMFAITAFYHRYFSHKAFKTSRAAQFVFAVLGATACQRGPLWWAAHHRHHHRHSDTEVDRHSPRRHGLLWSHVGWITAPGNYRTKVGLVKDLARYPELMFLDRFDMLVPALFGTLIFLLGGWQHFVWGFCISTVAVYHGTFFINSLAHMIGRRRYPTRDDSKNSLLLALLTLGEGWHNNHHYYPAAARQGFRWWEIDVTYYVLWTLERVRIIRDLRPVPAWVMKAG